MAELIQSKSYLSKRTRPASSPEARENQLISLAVNLAEKQLREGTASSQVITHYLKMGSTKEKLEKEILKEQKTLISAKADVLRSNKNMEHLYENAIAVFGVYRGGNADEHE